MSEINRRDYTMLQQILDQMFVDPEILDALDDEQKQILFIKMREEQVKRWKAFEEQCEKAGNPQVRKTQDSSRRIRWLLGEDGEVWVWVMGEHKDDLTIEQITEKRALEEARQLAEKEMLESMRLCELNDGSIPVVGPNEDENTLKEQLSRMEPWSSVNANSKIQESMYEDANSIFESNFNGNAPKWTLGVAPSPDFLPKGILKHPVERFVIDLNNYQADGISGSTSTEQFMMPEKSLSSNGSIKSSSSEGVHVLPSTSLLNVAFSESDSSVGLNTSESTLSGSSNYSLSPFHSHSEASIHLNRILRTKDDIPGPYEQRVIQVNTPKNKFTRPDTPIKLNSGMPTAQPISEIGGNFSTYPGAVTKNSRSVTFDNAGSSSGNSIGGVRFRAVPREKPNLTVIDEEISKRQSEIFEQLKEKHQQFDREAEQEAERVEQAWEEQERKAREAEAQIRRIAQKAREQHRQLSLRTSSSILPLLLQTNASSLREALKDLPRPPKPKSREAIINWFKTEELPKGTGLNPQTLLPAVWFHGIISRKKADELLENKPSGSFLVRVSERIWGYTVSYVVGDGNVKHFLIERITQGYQFLGTNQVVHKHLHELVAYHEVSPITLKGNEILRWAVGQVDAVPDYADLIPE